MPSTQVQARISPELKEESFRILDEMGLSFSDFIRLHLKKLTRDKSIKLELDLMATEAEEEFIVIKDEEHLKELINL